MNSRLLPIPSKINQDTSKSLRHINSLRHKPVNQLSQCLLSLCANSLKCNNSSLCQQIVACCMIEIAKTRVWLRRPIVGHVGQWVTFACAYRKIQHRVAAAQDGSPPVSTEQDQRSYKPVFVDAVDTKDSSQPWLAEIRVKS